jgi:PAS domain S-box-containing protein
VEFQTDYIYRAAFENSLDGILIAKEDMQIVDANPAVCSMLGMSREDFKSRDRRKITDTNSGKLKELLAQKARTGKVAGEITLVRKDGTMFPGEFTANTFRTSDGTKFNVIIIRDVSGRVAFESALGLNEANLSSLINGIDSSIWSIDNNMCLIYGNKIFTSRYHSLSGILLNPGDDVVKGLPVSIQNDWIGYYKRGLAGESFMIETFIQPPLNNIYIRYIFNPIKTGTGSIIGLTIISQDLTDLKKTETKLKRTSERLRRYILDQDKIREKERKIISQDLHDDLGQNLTAMNLHLAWIKKHLPPGQDKVFERLDSLSVLLSGMIEDVKDIAANLNPTILKAFGLAQAIRLQLESTSRHSGIKYDISFDAKYLSIDYKHTLILFRVFQESLTNIIKHSGATIVKLTVKKTSKYVHLVIVDNGKGISPESARSKTSMGLSGMKERVDSIGGRIAISGRKGIGTTIKVRLPLSV